MLLPSASSPRLENVEPCLDHVRAVSAGKVTARLRCPMQDSGIGAVRLGPMGAHVWTDQRPQNGGGANVELIPSTYNSEQFSVGAALRAVVGTAQ
jgi:hypothetical protein